MSHGASTSNAVANVTLQTSQPLSVSSPKGNESPLLSPLYSQTPQHTLPDGSHPGGVRKSRHRSTQDEMLSTGSISAGGAHGLALPTHASSMKPPQASMLQPRLLANMRELRKLPHSHSAGILHEESVPDSTKVLTPAGAEAQGGRVSVGQRLTLGALNSVSSFAPMESAARDTVHLPSQLIPGQGVGTSATHPTSISKAMGALGGDLKVRIMKARHLHGVMRSTVVYKAKVRGSESYMPSCQMHAATA